MTRPRYRYIVISRQLSLGPASRTEEKMGSRSEVRCALLVSKHPLLLASRAELLKSAGWEVHLAGTDAQALHSLWRDGCRVAVLCQTLTEREQTELEQQLLGLHPEVSIIRLGYGEEHDPRSFLEAMERVIE